MSKVVVPEDGLTFFWTLQKLLNNFLAALEMEIWYFDVEKSSNFLNIEVHGVREE